MYLRSTKRSRKDGSKVEYLQLAHNHWDPQKKRSRVEVIHNFGRADQLDRDALLRLSKSIASACGASVVDGSSGDHEGDTLLGDGVTLHAARGLGVPHVVERIWQELGLGKRLRRLAKKEGASPPLGMALLAVVANRLDAPTSKLGVYERWLETVFLAGASDIELRHLYEALDLYQKHQDELEEQTFFQLANLMNLEVDLVFYDTTTAEFAISEADEDDGWRKLGYSKDGRWTPQVVVALAVTREGFPVRSWVFPGNTTDVTTVQKIREDLRGWKLHRVLFVGDAGMNSESNRQELARACGKYVLATRTAGVNEVQTEVLGRAGRYKKLADNLKVKEVVVGDGERRQRYLVCVNPQQAKRERAHREQIVAELEEELKSHSNLDPTAKWAVMLQASGRYGRYLRVRNGKLTLNRDKIREAARHDGKWVLMTNDDSLSAEDVATAYKGMMTIERCFRSIKSVQIQLRPMFHRLERRIEAHVKLCVLALLIARIAEHRTGQSWAKIRHDLYSLQAVEMRTSTHRFFRCSELSSRAKRVLAALKIPPPKKILAVDALTPEDIDE